MRLAIFGQHVANVEQGEFEKVAEVLFVLVTVEAAHRSPTLPADFGQVICVEGRA